MTETAIVERPKRSVRLSKRGQKTRGALLESALTLVAETGYAATTTQAVLDHSGVSRGSLLHQFTTRYDLMVATAELAMSRMVSAIQKSLGAFDDPLEALYHYPDILWHVLNENPARANTEILLASRWDKDLEIGLRKAVAEVERRNAESTAILAEKIGVENPEALMAAGGVLVLAMEGLTTRAALTSDARMGEKVFALLKANFIATLESLTPRRTRRAAPENPAGT